MVLEEFRDIRLSSLDVAKLVKDYKDLLLSAFVANVYQAADVFCLKLHNVPGKRFLLLHPQYRFNLTNKVLEWRITPLVSVLRKHLRNKRIRSLSQYFFDRVIKIEFDEGLELVCEMIPRGVLVLLKDGVILAASQYAKMKDREIQIGVYYKYPPEPPSNPAEVPVDELNKRFMEQLPLLKNLMKLGIGPKYALELCKRLGLDCTKALQDFHQIPEIKERLTELFLEILNSKKGFVYLKEETPVFFSPIPLSFTESYKVLEFDAFDEAIDFYFSHDIIRRAIEEAYGKVYEKRKKLQHIIKYQKEAISKLEAKINKLKEVIETVYENYLLVDSTLQAIQKAKDLDHLDWDEIRDRIARGKAIGIKPAMIIKDIQNDGTVIFKIDRISFSANYRDTVNSLTSKLYQRIKKLEEKLMGAKEALEKSMLELQNLDMELKGIESKAACVIQEPKYEWYHGFRWFRTSKNALLVIAGKDAQTNETLLKKYREENDLILHAEVPGGAVVLVKEGKNRAAKEDLEEAAIYAASYSKAWREGLAAVDVFYTSADLISLTPPSGTYLKKGSFIVLKKEIIKNVKLELAIGIKLIKSRDIISISVQSSPLSAATSLDCYCIIRPGKLDKSAVVRSIHKYLVNRIVKETPYCDERKISKVVKIEKISELVPGSSEIEFPQQR
ncbi:MAG: ribosome rescue protein RqcH [Candidatus Korarchaeota archaeon]|nr:NFACT family protein [Thermoproteota archaeon]